jgi:1,4-alpha-glucan branching enzyme
MMTGSVLHRPELPWCYYDRERNRIILRLLAPGEVKAAFLVYGDPYDNALDRDGVRRWKTAEAAMTRQYAGAGPGSVWRIEAEVPPRRRLMYRFRLETPEGILHVSSGGAVPEETNPFEDREDSYFDHFFYPFVHEADSPQLPPWVKETVWYQIFPDRFYRGSAAPSPAGCADWDRDAPGHRNFFGGDLPGITEKLGYLRNLGINGLYLTPVFKAPSNHKYDTEDYYRVDEHFGSAEDLKRLAGEAHALGMRVMLDAVFNHAGERPHMRTLKGRCKIEGWKGKTTGLIKCWNSSPRGGKKRRRN